jgi:hypothetical protein
MQHHMVEVFKTNVENVIDAEMLVQTISQLFPNLKVNFALDDCDRILRLEGAPICNESIIKILSRHGYDAALLKN